MHVSKPRNGSGKNLVVSGGDGVGGLVRKGATCKPVATIVKKERSGYTGGFDRRDQISREAQNGRRLTSEAIVVDRLTVESKTDGGSKRGAGVVLKKRLASKTC